MPIYAYRCSTCGHAQDVLQKMSDPLLTVCPACGAAAFEKQLTAAGFQLKGSGWYVTDFRGGNTAAAKKDGDEKAADGAAEKPADKANDKPAEKPTDKAAEKSVDKPLDKAANKPAEKAPAPAPAAAAPSSSPPAASS